MEGARARVIAGGVVQGVNYRAECRRQALRHGLHGWVRNLPDQRVEAVLEGPEEAVRAAVEWCRRGPSLAVVRDFRVTWESSTGTEPPFEIRR